MKKNKFSDRIPFAIYDFLNVGQSPEKADCIFVYAGRPERKFYALELFRQGYAQCIVFSVGRFEWRGFPRLGLEQDGALFDLVQQTPPALRHFFVCTDGKQTQCFLIRLGKFGTFSEAMALAKYIQKENIKSLIVVSTAFHLRRATETLKGCCPNSQLRINPVAVPDELVSDARRKWWTNRKGVSLVLTEYVKYMFYRFMLPFFCNNSIENFN